MEQDQVHHRQRLVTGAFWSVKHQGDALKNIRFEVDTTRQRLTMDLVGQDKRSVFEPDRVRMQRGDGELIDARDNPEKSFEGQQFETPWDDLHLAYFTGEALWTYLNTPFVYTGAWFATSFTTGVHPGTPCPILGAEWERRYAARCGQPQ